MPPRLCYSARRVESVFSPSMQIATASCAVLQNSSIRNKFSPLHSTTNNVTKRKEKTSCSFIFYHTPITTKTSTSSYPILSLYVVVVFAKIIIKIVYHHTNICIYIAVGVLDAKTQRRRDATARSSGLQSFERGRDNAQRILAKNSSIPSPARNPPLSSTWSF